jgi:hypothetical protein
MKSIPALAATGLLAVGLWAASAARSDEVKSGPAVGTSLMLHVTPFNSDGKTFCVTCAAGMNPNAIVFVTKNDDATHKLLTQVDAEVKEHKDKNVCATILIVGNGDDATGLKQFVSDQKIAVPAACITADLAGLKDWDINKDAGNTVVYFKEHKVQCTAADTSADELAKTVDKIIG